jgi:hypothetical protein
MISVRLRLHRRKTAPAVAAEAPAPAAASAHYSTSQGRLSRLPLLPAASRPTRTLTSHPQVLARMAGLSKLMLKMQPLRQSCGTCSLGTCEAATMAAGAIGSVLFLRHMLISSVRRGQTGRDAQIIYRPP